MSALRMGVDIGGTFTDITVLEEETGRVSIAKVPSRRGDPAGALIEAVERGLAEADAEPEAVTLLVHGSTLVTNAVLENKLPPTSLLTTEGFRDVLEIGRHFRPDMYDLLQDVPRPVVPRDRRFCVAERTAPDGELLVEPRREEVESLFDDLRAGEVEAVAVCFLNSYVNPANESAVRDWLRQGMPGVEVSASCDVCREIREFERMSTVVLNAAAMPLVAKYLGEIAPRLGAVLPNAKLLLMQSSGGSLTVSAARDFPVRMVTSGPAGGALAVQRLGRATEEAHLLGVDMGGTSTDICLINGGELRMTTEGEIAGRPIKLPMIEINTIGAGAGSIAWLDEAGGLHVGPHSAGAEPGPVAYGQGGTEPTVTDANLVLGRLHPERFASGLKRLDVEAARRAIAEKIGGPLGHGLEQAAAGIVRIANANMERAVRVSSAEKGYDPRDITLVAFGGAGPMHAAALAAAVGIPTVMVPEQPGVFSAVGLVMADIRHDFVQTQVLRGAEITAAAVVPLYEQLEARAQEALAQDGVAEERREIRRLADLRYLGQAYEVNVPLSGGTLDQAAMDALVERFHALHQQLYAHSHPDKPVEFVSARVAAIGLQHAPALRRRDGNGADLGQRESRPVFFDEADGFLETPVYERHDIAPGSSLSGPAIVEQVDSTIVIHPNQTAQVDEYGNLLIAIGKAGS